MRYPDDIGHPRLVKLPRGWKIILKKILTRVSFCCRNAILFEPLAQSVEHLTFNQVVVGSIPTRLTTEHVPFV